MFKDFCELLNEIKSPKEARDQIADYLKILSSKDQIIACNFLMGTPLEREKIGFSKKTVEKIIIERYGIEFNGHKSLGDIFLNVNESKHSKHFLTLNEINEMFILLSKTTTEKDRQLYLKIIDLPNIQKKWFIDILLNKLQLGLGFGVIKYSIAKVYNVHLTECDYVWNRTKSISSVIKFLNGMEFNSKIGVPISPQLAKDVSKKMDKIEYPVQVEGKYDGFRAQIHVHDNGKIQIFSRSMQEKTDAFPDIVMILRNNLINPGIYDGEIYGINSDYSPMAFEKFQHRLGVKEITEEIIKEYPATIVLFDVIYHKSGNHDEVQFKRTQFLEACSSYYSPSRIVDNKEELMQSFGHAIDMGYEGLMIKKMYGKYIPGEGKTNWGNWYKFKGGGETLDVLIIGGQMGTGSKRNVYSSFDIAVLMGPGILYPIGKVGGGFTMEDLESITRKVKIIGNIQDLNLIIEIKFDKVMVNEDDEYHLRFPQFKRFRSDKMINEINTLDEIKEINEK